MKRPTTVNLDEETRERIERARKRLARGAIIPSQGDVMREALNRGLQSLEKDQTPPPRAA